MAQKIQIRRGLSADGAAIVFEIGELFFYTDTQVVGIGDGVTTGGIPLGTVGGGGSTIHGVYDIPNGVDTVTVSGLGLLAAPVHVHPTVSTLGPGLTLQATTDRSSYSTDGFTAALNGITDSANYKIHYIIYLS